MKMKTNKKKYFDIFTYNIPISFFNSLNITPTKYTVIIIYFVHSLRFYLRKTMLLQNI